MQAPMKEPHIDADVVELKFVGPSGKKVEAIQALQSLGFVNLGEALPWRLAFPEYDEKSFAWGGPGRSQGQRRHHSAGAGRARGHSSAPYFRNGTEQTSASARKWPKNWGKLCMIDYRALL